MSRRSPIQVGRDFMAKAKRKKEIAALLSQCPVGQGVEVPLKGDPLLTIAIQELVKESHGRFILVEQPNGAVLLTHAGTLSGGNVSADLSGFLYRGGSVLDADRIQREGGPKLWLPWSKERAS